MHEIVKNCKNNKLNFLYRYEEVTALRWADRLFGGAIVSLLGDDRLFKDYTMTQRGVVASHSC